MLDRIRPNVILWRTMKPLFPVALPFRLMLPMLWMVVLAFTSVAQDRLKSMPGYERYERVTKQMTNVFTSGALNVTWQDGGKAFEYQKAGQRFRYDITTRSATLLTNVVATKTNAASSTPTNKAVSSTSNPPRRSARTQTDRERPERGRQFTNAPSPDEKWRAFYRDRNLWLSTTNSTNALAITTDGSDRTRVKNGAATWVYGEELFQTTAIWWSSNNQQVAFYRFDESRVPDFPLALNQSRIQSTLDLEPYVKAGGTNPIVDLLIYDLPTKQTVRVDVRDGQAFTEAVVGHYVYGVAWSSDGKELLFHRTNRRQNILEFVAANPKTGKCRVIVREEWPDSWTENLPPHRFLKDGHRFIWASERTGWNNFYLYDLNARAVHAPVTLTHHGFEVANIVRVDEAAGLLYYTARDGDNPMKLQLHRVGLDGAGDTRLTDPAFHHGIDFAPDGQHFIDVAQTHDSPPVTRLRKADGECVAELAQSDLTRFKKFRMKPVELLQFKAADGVTDLYGMLHFPSDFVPYHKYPLLVSVYAGPATTGARETFTLPDRLTEYGFLVATFDSRSASGRGKKFLDAIYQKLGTVEIDDQAAGVRALGQRRYVDKKRVGIFGTSYGGTASALCLLRYPEVFRAAASSSAVTDFRHYDSIYAERYLGLPQENTSGYDAAAVLTYADKLNRRLLLYYGTADNNVHPNNTLQLVQALQSAGKSFELQVGPDLGHTSVNRERMMEFFIENLVK